MKIHCDIDDRGRIRRFICGKIIRKFETRNFGWAIIEDEEGKRHLICTG